MKAKYERLIFLSSFPKIIIKMEKVCIAINNVVIGFNLYLKYEGMPFM